MSSHSGRLVALALPIGHHTCGALALALVLSCALRLGAADGDHTRYAAAVLDPTVPSGFSIVFTSEFGGAPSGPAVAWGEYKEDMNSTGWSWLELQTNASYTDTQQAVAAGVVEGGLTRERLDEYLHNTGAAQDFGDQLQGYIRRNTEWARRQAQQHLDDPFWHHVGLAYDQLEGLLAGYNAVRERDGSRAVDWATFYALTISGGDADDLCEVFACSGRLQQRVQNTSNSHCSALIRMDEGEVFMGHSTWSQFESMTRIYKLYNLAFRASTLPGSAVAFPSYPGVIVSIDDFYQTSAGLVVMETTNENANTDLWKLVVPESLLYWVRAFVSNLLADSGPAWADMFSRHNSGTYNNQWMVVDTKLLPLPHPGKTPPTMPLHTLTVMELLPGRVHIEDETHFLQAQGYWMSYNRPFFPDIFELSGQPALVERYGDHYSWERTARAQIFRRLVPSVVDHASYQHVMRYNNFATDPVGTQGCKGSPSASNAIAERGDLTSADAGCLPDIRRQDEAQTDVKYTTASLMRRGALAAVAQSGPTYDSQPPFRWSSSPFAHVLHRGQPDLWHFPWVNVTWRYRAATAQRPPPTRLEPAIVV